MLKLPSISTKEHSRLHLVNRYGLFLDCWSKTNCTPAKSWTLNQISTRTDVRLWIFRRRSYQSYPFSWKNISKSFFKNSWHITRSRIIRFRCESPPDQKLRQQLPAQGQIRSGRCPQDCTLYSWQLGRIAPIFRYGQYTYPVKNLEFPIQLLYEAEGCRKGKPHCTAG